MAIDNRVAQVEIIVFKFIGNEPVFLLAKRNEEKGGFWQPFTGGAKPGEDLAEAAKRELFEETGIDAYKRFIPNIYHFEFNAAPDVRFSEFVFAAEIDDGADAVLSSEHTEKRWCRLGEALSLLKYNSNKEALRKLNDIIKS